MNTRKEILLELSFVANPFRCLGGKQIPLGREEFLLGKRFSHLMDSDLGLGKKKKSWIDRAEYPSLHVRSIGWDFSLFSNFIFF